MCREADGAGKDWFNPNTQDFWSGEYQRFFSADTGIDIDGAWIDMNEPSSVCLFDSLLVPLKLMMLYLPVL